MAKLVTCQGQGVGRASTPSFFPPTNLWLVPPTGWVQPKPGDKGAQSHSPWGLWQRAGKRQVDLGKNGACSAQGV